MYCRSQKGKDEKRMPARVQTMQEARMFKMSKPNEIQKAKELFDKGLSKLDIAKSLSK